MVVRLDLDYRILFSNCLWTWGPSRRKQYVDRINLDWHDIEGMYLVTSLDPELSVGRFLEIEGLETGRGRLTRNIDILLAERGGPPQMPREAEGDALSDLTDDLQSAMSIQTHRASTGQSDPTQKPLTGAP